MKTTEENAARDKNQEGNPIVEVLSLKTNNEEKFHASWQDTLAQVWEQAYIELKEQRGPADEFECQDGTSLKAHLNQTLAQLREQHICQNRKFQIKGEIGGA